MSNLITRATDPMCAPATGWRPDRIAEHGYAGSRPAAMVMILGSNVAPAPVAPAPVAVRPEALARAVAAPVALASTAPESAGRTQLSTKRSSTSQFRTKVDRPPRGAPRW